MDQNMFRQIIMEHNNTPNNKVEELNDDSYVYKEALNPSCGDMVVVYLKFDGDMVVDIKFKGQGCHICCASASILTDELNNMNKEDILNKINQFDHLLKGEEIDDDLFEEAIVLSSLSKSPARYKCAHISWDTVRKIIQEA